MKTLSEFLAEYLLDRKDFNNEEWENMLKWFANEIHEGLEEYKKYLISHKCKTIHWKEVEKQIVDAITKAESVKSIYNLGGN